MKANVHVVIDRSGSMSSIKNDAIEGFNAFLAKTRGKDQKWWVWQFDTGAIDPLHDGVDPSAIPYLTAETYQPRGGTPLYDAIGKAVTAGREARKVKKNLLVILTDGEENASSEYNRDGVKALLKELEGKDWQIVYLAANQDAFEVGLAFGLPSASTAYVTLTGSGASHRGGYDYASNMARSYFAGAASTFSNVAVNDSGEAVDKVSSTTARLDSKRHEHS